MYIYKMAYYLIIGFFAVAECVMYIFKPYDRVQGKFPFMPPSGSLLRRGDRVRCR